jgi:protoporphyrinogen oxidase
MDPRRAVIIGAGPAGLTAAYELLTRTNITPLVIEKDDCVGGISRTVNYKGNRMDIGGHRFFSRSARVMDWWLRMLPIGQPAADERTPGISSDDRVMLLRHRKSRIYYLQRFFDYQSGRK